MSKPRYPAMPERAPVTDPGPAAEAPPIRVTLADDSVLFREGLARLLADSGFIVAGQAATPVNSTPWWNGKITL